MKDKNADVWENIFATQAWGQYPESAIVRFLMQNFSHSPNRKDVKILELGSGPGVNLWLLTREGYSAYAIEFSPTAAEKAKARLKKEGTEALLKEIKVGDYYEKLDEFENDYFDAVIDYESLYCNPFPRTKEIILKACAKLKNGGKFFSVTFTENTWGFEGERVDYHAVITTEGPLANKGFSRFSTKEDVISMFNHDSLTITKLELIERTLTNGKKISEWVIEVEKQ